MYCLASYKQFDTVNGSRRMHIVQVVTDEDGVVDTTKLDMRYGPCNCPFDLTEAGRTHVHITCKSNDHCLRYNSLSESVPSIFWKTVDLVPMKGSKQ